MKILIFGGSGTIGKPLVKLLEENHRVFSPTKKACNIYHLQSLADYNYNFLSPHTKIDCVLNLAAIKTNISLNKTNPANIYTETVQMGLNIFEFCKSYNIPRLINCVCSCSYGEAKLLKEEDFDKTPPNSTVLAHAYAKRQLYYMAKFYKQQYNLQTLTLCFNNVYGKLDHDYNSVNSLSYQNYKVLDSLFLKMLFAKRTNQPKVEIFGSGKPRREFIYYENVATAINDIVNQELYRCGNDPTMYHNFKGVELMNIGMKEDITISELAQLIKSIIGYNGKLVYDKSKPDGQMVKLLDNSLFKKYFPNFKFHSLELGINQMALKYCPEFYYDNERTYRLVGE